MKISTGLTQISVILPEELKEKVVGSAKENERSMNKEIIMMIKNYFQMQNGLNNGVIK